MTAVLAQGHLDGNPGRFIDYRMRASLCVPAYGKDLKQRFYLSPVFLMFSASRGAFASLRQTAIFPQAPLFFSTNQPVGAASGNGSQLAGTSQVASSTITGAANSAYLQLMLLAQQVNQQRSNGSGRRLAVTSQVHGHGVANIAAMQPTLIAQQVNQQPGNSAQQALSQPHGKHALQRESLVSNDRSPA